MLMLAVWAALKSCYAFGTITSSDSNPTEEAECCYELLLECRFWVKLAFRLFRLIAKAFLESFEYGLLSSCA